MSTEAFVNRLEVPKTPVEAAIDALKKEGEERVLLIGNTVCIFADNVPASVAEDVAASMRLIGLSSEKAFNKETQQREWYNYYTNGLAKLGWTMTGGAHVEEAMDQEKSTLANVAVNVIIRDLGPKHRMARCLGRGFRAIAHAPDANRLFERSSSTTSGKSIRSSSTPIDQRKSLETAIRGGFYYELQEARDKLSVCERHFSYLIQQNAFGKKQVLNSKVYLTCPPTSSPRST